MDCKEIEQLMIKLSTSPDFLQALQTCLTKDEFKNFSCEDNTINKLVLCFTQGYMAALEFMESTQKEMDNYCEYEHIPNEETARAIEEARRGEGTVRCEILDDILDDFRKKLREKNKCCIKGINLICGKCESNVNSFRIRYDRKYQAYIFEDAFLDLNLNDTFFDWDAK